MNGDSYIGYKYPDDIKYNVCEIGNYVVHNFDFTDNKILEIIQKNKKEMININQGYSNCSIAVIDKNAVIVTDKNIAENLKKNNIDVLYLDYIPDIKLFNQDNVYSKMNGFIGGAISRIGNKVIVFGDLGKIDKDNMILEFIKKYNLEVVDFKKLDVIDYGGIVII